MSDQFSWAPRPPLAQWPPHALRITAVACSIGAILLSTAGCQGLGLSRRKQLAKQLAPPAAPQPLETPPGTVAVDLSRPQDDTPFLPHPTQTQRIRVHLDFGRVFESQGSFEAALAEYQDALAACENRGLGKSFSQEEALAHRRMGNVLDKLGRFAQAEVHYKQALKLKPKDPKVWNDAGYSYYLQGRWADAERALKTAAKLDPQDSRIKTNLGLTLAAAGRTKEALPLLSQFSGDAIGHANLGYLLAATGQLELARQQYLQALALRPNLELAQRALDRIEQMQESGGAPIAAGLPTSSGSGTQDATSARDGGVVQTGSPAIPIPPPRRFSNTPSLTRPSLP
jgi:tetratricopeptide (TPR) repeat protein